MFLQLFLDLHPCFLQFEIPAGVSPRSWLGASWPADMTSPPSGGPTMTTGIEHSTLVCAHMTTTPHHTEIQHSPVSVWPVSPQVHAILPMCMCGVWLYLCDSILLTRKSANCWDHVILHIYTSDRLATVRPCTAAAADRARETVAELCVPWPWPQDLLTCMHPCKGSSLN